MIELERTENHPILLILLMIGFIIYMIYNIISIKKLKNKVENNQFNTLKNLKEVEIAINTLYSNQKTIQTDLRSLRNLNKSNDNRNLQKSKNQIRSLIASKDIGNEE